MHNRFGSGIDAQLRKYIGKMGLYGPVANEQLFANLLIAHAMANQP
jgi:hypothetical protein